jgi:hypothetical protein
MKWFPWTHNLITELIRWNTDSSGNLMRTLAEFNGIRDPKINLTQVCWDLNELITMEDLLQGNKTINQLDHNAYTWRRAKEV